VIIESSAPTRVDLAGGTIDIWPLYLFHPGATTVNFAVNLMAKCFIETRDDERIIIESRDRHKKVETTLSDIDELARDAEIELVSKLVHFFRPTTGIHLITESQAPAGAGLAGSSALNIACIGALNRLAGNRYNEKKFIPIAANIESTVIRVPAGFQDYYSAFYGGTSSIHFNFDGIVREELKVDAETLESRIAICYTGEPRNSGINNWEIFKHHIDGNKEIFSIFDGIRDSAIEMREALIANDWQAVSKIMFDGHPHRKKLAPTITTPHMDSLIEKAMNNGAEAVKVCGAGGGGCIAFLCEKGRRKEVENALAVEDGAEVLDWRYSAQGLTVEVS